MKHNYTIFHSVFLVILFFSANTMVCSQSQGPNNPATVTTGSAACLACQGSLWTTPANAEVADGFFTGAPLAAAGSCFQTNCYRSRPLLATNFGFNIPANATISYIVVHVKREGTVAAVIMDSLVSVMKANVISGANHAHPDYWPGTNTDTSYGGPGDLWGTTWTPADINATGFGVALIAKNTSATLYNAYVDNINVTVYYTLPTAGPPVAAFIANDTAPCRNDTVRFTDMSSGATSWAWSFPGGVPGTSSLQNPAVVYSADGWHNVTLIATNANGSDTLTVSNYIYEKSLITSLTVHPTVYCKGDTGLMSVSVSGAASSYQWNPCTGLSACNASNTKVFADSTTTYSVLVIDSNGCGYSSSATDTVHPKPDIHLPGPNAVCDGDTVLLHASSTGAVSFQWSPCSHLSNCNDSVTDAFPSGSTHYEVIVLNVFGCRDSTGVLVNINQPVTPTISISGDTLLSSAAASYQWYRNGILIPGATAQMYVALVTDSYSVATTDVNGCRALSAQRSIVITGIEEIGSDQGLYISPNPSVGIFFIHLPQHVSQDISLDIFDELGRKVWSKQNISDGMIDVSVLPQGMYIIYCKGSTLQTKAWLLISK